MDFAAGIGDSRRNRPIYKAREMLLEEQEVD